MRWSRSNFVRRLVAAVLITSMVPALIVPSSRASSSSLYGPYSQWLRTQLRVPADATVERALLRAAESGANSFEQFVQAFLEAYESDHPETPISKAFTDRDLSRDALVSYLQRRYTRIAGEANLPRLRLVSASSSAASAPGGDAACVRAEYEVVFTTAQAGMPWGVSDHFTPVRLLTSARPQGP